MRFYTVCKSLLYGCSVQCYIAHLTLMDLYQFLVIAHVFIYAQICFCGSLLPVNGVRVSVTFHLTCAHIIFLVRFGLLIDHLLQNGGTLC